MAEEEVHTAAAADIVHERDKDDGVAHDEADLLVESLIAELTAQTSLP